MRTLCLRFAYANTKRMLFFCFIAGMRKLRVRYTYAMRTLKHNVEEILLIPGTYIHTL